MPVPDAASPADSSTYAAFLFNAFDTDHDGSISFEVSPCPGWPVPRGPGRCKGEPPAPAWGASGGCLGWG